MRECRPCTKCCEGNLDLVVEGIPITKKAPCKYIDSGCSIHGKQPNVCSEFKCGWLIDKQLPDDMRPDLSGVIIILAMYHWMKRPVDMAVPTDNEIPDTTLKFIQHYASCEVRPLIYCENGEKGRIIYPYGPEKFQDAIAIMANKGHQFT